MRYRNKKYRKFCIVSQIETLVGYICIEIMEEKYSNGVEWWFAELGSESEVDKRFVLFPELNSRCLNLLSAIY